jgi:phage FluMu protein Com
MARVVWHDIRCPACHKLLLQAFGISAHLALRIVCDQCHCLISIHEGFVAEVISQ